jgi:hypothetical protein
MKKLLNGLLLIFAVLSDSNSVADIYRWKDSKGRTVYGAEPPRGTFATVVPNNMTEYEYVPAGVESNGQPSQSGAVWAEAANAPYQQCAETKRRAVYLEKRKAHSQAERLNEWLWKECRIYSNELRKIEQEMM